MKYLPDQRNASHIPLNHTMHTRDRRTTRTASWRFGQNCQACVRSSTLHQTQIFTHWNTHRVNMISVWNCESSACHMRRGVTSSLSYQKLDAAAAAKTTSVGGVNEDSERTWGAPQRLICKHTRCEQLRCTIKHNTYHICMLPQTMAASQSFRPRLRFSKLSKPHTNSFYACKLVRTPDDEHLLNMYFLNRIVHCIE